ncbi:MAG: hypothetical protein R2911_26340 [Caldilineaceae bacterium]
MVGHTGGTVRCSTAAGVYEAALTTNRQLLKLAPWDEAARRQQIQLLLAK